MSVVINKIKDRMEELIPVLVQGKRGYMKCEFRSNSIYHLSYEAGTPIQHIKSCPDNSMIMVENLEGKTGFVKKSDVDFFHDSHLLLLDFYHGYTRTETVENLMKDAMPGSFLLRNSTQIANGLSLDIKCKCNDEIHRMRIINENSLFYVSDEIFKDIGEILKATTFHPNEPQYQIHFTNPLHTKNSNRDYIVAKTLIKNRQFLRPSSVISCKIIGGGQYGEIHKGKYNNMDVAIKVSKIAEQNMSGPSEFANEVAMMHELYHRNVVHFVGCVLKQDKIVQVVMEWCDKGDLNSYVTDTPLMSPDEMFGIIHQIANGFKYIHSKNIVHGDIAARNILLTYDMIPKITDFGLATYEKKVIPKKTMMPKRWMAPESMVTKTINLITDVWSFGVLMWEVYSHAEIPYVSIDAADLYKYLAEDHNRLAKPFKCPEDVYKTMCLMWDEDIRTRITFAKIMDIFDKMKVSEESTYEYSIIE